MSVPTKRKYIEIGEINLGPNMLPGKLTYLHLKFHKRIWWKNQQHMHHSWFKIKIKKAITKCDIDNTSK